MLRYIVRLRKRIALAANVRLVALTRAATGIWTCGGLPPSSDEREGDGVLWRGGSAVDMWWQMWASGCPKGQEKGKKSSAGTKFSEYNLL